MAALGIPGSSTLGLAVSRASERRKRAAIDLLIEEVAKGKTEDIEFTNEYADELVQMLLRFSSAVDAGAARQILRLSVQVIFGLSVTRSLNMTNFQNGPTFSKHSQEMKILFLGAAHHIMNETPNEFWKKIRESLSSKFSSDECNEVAGALTRTGLILPVSAWGEWSTSQALPW
jgi:hypothetical protein